MADYINKIRTTEGDKPVNYEALANKPNSLPNPNKIKFTGSVVAEYDGSSEVTVDIQNGASEEQAAQIQTNTNDISELKSDIEHLKQNGTGTGTGLSTEAIDKLEEVGNYLVYTTADGGSKWKELISILRGTSGGETEQPESGIVQTGSILAISSGVTATQAGTVLAIA